MKPKELIGAAIGAALAIWTAENCSAGELHQTALGGCVMDTDGVDRYLDWPNNTGQIMYLRGGKMFMGMDMGVKSDFTAYIAVVETGAFVIFRGWDHYADPVSSDPNNPREFFPDGTYMTLYPGWHLRFDAVASPQSGPYHHMQANAWVYWTDQP